MAFQASAGMGSENSVTAAIDKAEHVILGNFLTETNATRAENAAFVIECNARSDFHPFRFFDFIFQKTRIGAAIFDAKFLQSTFPSLIADGTVERMINQQKLHHPPTALLGQRRIGANAHSFGNVLRAGNLRAWHPIDDWFGI